MEYLLELKYSLLLQKEFMSKNLFEAFRNGTITLAKSLILWGRLLIILIAE